MLPVLGTPQRQSRNSNVTKGRQGMTRDRFVNIGTTAWAVALAIGALLYMLGVTPAFAQPGIDCHEACEEAGYCDDNEGCAAAEREANLCRIECRDGFRIVLTICEQ